MIVQDKPPQHFLPQKGITIVNCIDVFRGKTALKGGKEFERRIGIKNARIRKRAKDGSKSDLILLVPLYTESNHFART